MAGRSHIDFGAQDMGAVLEFTGLHAAKEQHVFIRRPLAVGRVFARLGQRAAIGAHFVGILTVDIGMSGLDQVFGTGDHPVEIVGGVVKVVFVFVLPGKTEPAHSVDDRVDVFGFFLFRIGVVKAQVAAATIVARQAEVQADRFGVAKVQVTVWLRRKTRTDLCCIRAAG